MKREEDIHTSVVFDMASFVLHILYFYVKYDILLTTRSVVDYQSRKQSRK